MKDTFAQLCTENIQPRPRRGGWHGGATPVGALRGVDSRVASWRPTADRKTIWELALHIAYWKYAVRRRLERGLGLEPAAGDQRFPLSPANWPSAGRAGDESTWAAHVAALKREHHLLTRTVATIPSASYSTVLPGKRGWSVGEVILGVAQHDAYHTGQIQLLKRLSPPARGRSS